MVPYFTSHSRFHQYMHKVNTPPRPAKRQVLKNKRSKCPLKNITRPSKSVSAMPYSSTVVRISCITLLIPSPSVVNRTCAIALAVPDISDSAGDGGPFVSFFGVTGPRWKWKWERRRGESPVWMPDAEMGRWQYILRIRFKPGPGHAHAGICHRPPP